MSPGTASDSRDIVLPDAAATLALGRRLGNTLEPGDVVCLSGALGAGKTTLARGGIAAWTGQEEETPSPTFTLVQTYDGPKGELWHVDLYRLKRPEELRLHPERELPHLVKEERPAARRLEEPRPIVRRARERAPDVPKELALEERVADGPAVDG